MRTRIATLADAEVIAEVQCAAFMEDRLFVTIYPHRKDYPEDFQRARAELTRQRLLDPNMITFVAEDEETGRMAGIAMWKKLNSSEPVNPHNGVLMDLERVLENASQKVSRVLRRNRAEDPSKLKLVYGVMDAGKTKYVKDQTTWYLNILAVHPDFQKRGVGKTLCRRGMELAEKDGIPTYLEASAQGEGMYRNLGWKDVGSVPGDFGVMMVMAWYPTECKVRFGGEA
ncbi:acyl-CoA N-acyltransferase [Ascodesmis nigricans]|uniref:Acyl-CoA N-acyltransferase n=1 Tax=Ascodesmis nigricans TaxID=341454 RepID=A0A4S2N8I7_9PEZI|nr:acyl-CoA N-acyltransferase [Ascodesmis nigricans]